MHSKTKLVYRIIAVVLAVLMAVPTSSMTAYAQPLDNGAGYNDEIGGNGAVDETPDSDDNGEPSEGENIPSGAGENTVPSGDDELTPGGTDTPGTSSEKTDDADEDGIPVVSDEALHNLIYTDNEDGTHTVSCSDDECDYTETEEHEFIDGVCVCGALEMLADDEHSLEYTDNEDGTHTAVCMDDECDYSLTEEHTFVEGVCICGAKENSIAENGDAEKLYRVERRDVGTDWTLDDEYDYLSDALQQVYVGVRNWCYADGRSNVEWGNCPEYKIVLNGDASGDWWTASDGSGYQYVTADAGNYTHPLIVDLNGHNLTLTGNDIYISGTSFVDGSVGDSNSSDSKIIISSASINVIFKEFAAASGTDRILVGNGISIVDNRKGYYRSIEFMDNGLGGGCGYGINEKVRIGSISTGDIGINTAGLYCEGDMTCVDIRLNALMPSDLYVEGKLTIANRGVRMALPASHTIIAKEIYADNLTLYQNTVLEVADTLDINYLGTTTDSNADMSGDVDEDAYLFIKEGANVSVGTLDLYSGLKIGQVSALDEISIYPTWNTEYEYANTRRNNIISSHILDGNHIGIPANTRLMDVVSGAGVETDRITVCQPNSFDPIYSGCNKAFMVGHSMYVGGEFITISAKTVDGNWEVLKSFTDWETAAKYIANINDSSAEYEIKLSKDIDMFGNFVLPTVAKSMTFTATDPVTVKYLGDINLTCDLRIENIKLEASFYDSKTKVITPDYHSAVKLNGKNLSLFNCDADFDSITGDGKTDVNIVDTTYDDFRDGGSSNDIGTIYVDTAISKVKTLRLQGGQLYIGTDRNNTKQSAQNAAISAVDTIMIDCANESYYVPRSELSTIGTTNVSNLIITSASDMLSAAYISFDGNTTIRDIVSDVQGNVIEYAGQLSITGNVSGTNTAYGYSDKAFENALILTPKAFEAFGGDISSMQGEAILKAQGEASAVWFIVSMNPYEAEPAYVGTYKVGDTVYCGENNKTVDLYKASTELAVDSTNWVIESSFDTFAEALKRIDAINVSSNYYKIVIKDTQGNYTVSAGTNVKTKDKYANWAMPSKLKKLTIAAGPATGCVLLNMQDSLTLKSDLEFDGIDVEPAVAATVALGNYQLTLHNSSIDTVANAGVKSITGPKGAGTSKLVLDESALVVGSISNVSEVEVKSGRIDGGVYGETLKCTGAMSVVTLKLAAGVGVRCNAAVTVTNIENEDGAFIVVPATISINKKTKINDKLIPMLTINGKVTNTATEIDAVDDAKRLKLIISNASNTDTPIDFENDLSEAVIAAGIPVAVAPKVPSVKVGISGDNTGSMTGCIQKNAGNIVFVRGTLAGNAKLSYEEDGELYTSAFTTLAAALDDIGRSKIARDYTITINEEATKTAVNGKSGAFGDYYNAPAAVKMPAASTMKSLTIASEDGSPVELWYTGNITSTTNLTLKNIRFVQFVAHAKNGYIQADALSDYPAVATVSTGGYVLTVGGDGISFNTPVNLSGAKKGSLKFEATGTYLGAGKETQMYNPHNVGAGYGSIGTYDFLGNITDFDTIELKNALDVWQYKTAAKKIAASGNVSANNIYFAADGINFFSKGNLTAKNVYSNANNTTTIVEGKANITNLSFAGTDTTIEAWKDFNITGSLVCTGSGNQLHTWQKYDAKKKAVTGTYLSITGTVLVDDRDAHQVGITVYAPDTAEDTYIPAELKGAPAASAMLAALSKGSVDAFAVDVANVPGEYSDSPYSATNTDGWYLKKTSGKLYVYYGDTAAVALVKSSSGELLGSTGYIAPLYDNIIGFYPTLADAVAEAEAFKDKTAKYTFVLMDDIGSETAPISLVLPANAAEVEVVSVSQDAFNTSAGFINTPYKIYFKNAVALKSNTVFTNVDLEPVAVKTVKKVVTSSGAKLNINAGAYNLSLIETKAGTEKAGAIKDITGNSKNTLTIGSNMLKIAGNISKINKFVVTSPIVYYGGAPGSGVQNEFEVGGSVTVSTLEYADRAELSVMGAVSVTDIYTTSDSILRYTRDAKTKKPNLNVKGKINSQPGIALRLVYSIPGLSDCDSLFVYQVADLKNASKQLAYLSSNQEATDGSFPYSVYVQLPAAGDTVNDLYSYMAPDGSPVSIIQYAGSLYASMCGDVKDSSILLRSSRIVDGEMVTTQKHCIDFASAVNEINSIGTADTDFVIEINNNLDDLNISDNIAASAMVLPAAGKAASLKIQGPYAPGPSIRFSGNITYSGDLEFENITFTMAVLDKKNNIISENGSAAVVVNQYKTKALTTPAKLTLDAVTFAGDGRISSIAGTKGVTEVTIENNTYLQLANGINNVKALTLDSSNLITGKASTITDLYLKNSLSSYNIWDSLASINIQGNIYTHTSGYELAAPLTNKKLPNITLGGKVLAYNESTEVYEEYGSVVDANKISLNFLNWNSTLDVQNNLLRDDNISNCQRIPLIQAKNANPEAFEILRDATATTFVRDSSGYISYIYTGDGADIVTVDVQDGEGNAIGTFTADNYYNAVSTIDAMNHPEYIYTISLPDGIDNGTGAGFTYDASASVSDASKYGALVTPTKANRVVIGSSTPGIKTGLKFTGAISPKCNIEFADIEFKSGSLNKSKVYLETDACEISAGNVYIVFNNCSTVKNFDPAPISDEDSTIAGYNLVFSKIVSKGEIITYQSIFSNGDINVADFTLNDAYGTCVVHTNGAIAVSDTVHIVGNAVLDPGKGKAVTLNNISNTTSYSTSELKINSYYSYGKKETNDPMKQSSLISIGGEIMSYGESSSISVNILPYVYNEGTNDGKWHMLAKDSYIPDDGLGTGNGIGSYAVHNSVLYEKPAAYKKFASISSAGTENLGVYYYDYTNSALGILSGYADGGLNNPTVTIGQGVSGSATERTTIYVKPMRYNGGLYLMRTSDEAEMFIADNKSRISGYGITLKAYHDNYDAANCFAVADFIDLYAAVDEIDSRKDKTALYEIILNKTVGEQILYMDGIERTVYRARNLKLPTYAKEVKFMSNITYEDRAVAFTGDVKLTCNVVVDEGVVFTSVDPDTTERWGNYYSVQYALSLGKFRYEEINPYQDYYAANSTLQSMKSVITGQAGSEYICLIGTGNDGRKLNTSVASAKIDGLSKLSIESLADLNSDLEFMIPYTKVENLSVKTSGSSANGTVKLDCNSDLIVTKNADLVYTTAKANNISVAGLTTLKYVKLIADNNKFGAGAVTLNDVTIDEPEAIARLQDTIIGKQDKNGKSLISINGELAYTGFDGGGYAANDPTQAFLIGLKYYDGSRFAKLTNDMHLLNAAKIPANCFEPYYNEYAKDTDGMGNRVASLGDPENTFSLYANGKGIYYARETVSPNAEASLVFVTDADSEIPTETVRYYATLEEAFSALKTYGNKDIRHKYAVIKILNNVEIGNEKKKGDYKALAIPSTVDKLTIYGNGNTVKFSGNIAFSGIDATVKDLTFVPMKSKKVTTANLSYTGKLILDHVRVANGATSLLNNLQGAAGSELVLVGGELKATQISTTGAVTLATVYGGEPAELSAVKNATIDTLHFKFEASSPSSEMPTETVKAGGALTIGTIDKSRINSAVGKAIIDKGTSIKINNEINYAVSDQGCIWLRINTSSINSGTPVATMKFGATYGPEYYIEMYDGNANSYNYFAKNNVFYVSTRE